MKLVLEYAEVDGHRSREVKDAISGKSTIKVYSDVSWMGGNAAIENPDNLTGQFNDLEISVKSSKSAKSYVKNGQAGAFMVMELTPIRILKGKAVK